MTMNFTNPALDPTLEGGGIFIAPANATSDHHFNIPRAMLFNGISFYSDQADVGDKIGFIIEYWAGTAWLRFKKFGKNWGVSPKTREEIILFPAHPVVGMRFRFKYENASAVDVKFLINVFNYVDIVDVDPLKGEQGEDW